MAIVVLNQPTDMLHFPIGIGAPILVTPIFGGSDNLLEVYGTISALSFLGAFTNNGSVTGTINHAWIDNADNGILPNVEMTGLFFTFDSAYYDAIIKVGNLSSVVFSLLSGDDVITGSPGIDYIRGYDGNDTMLGGGGSDFFDGGNQIDTVSYAGVSAGVFAALENTVFNTGEALGDVYAAVENLTGTGFGDTLWGTGGTNRLSGVGGNDVLVGKGGGDILDGGAGSDTASYERSVAAVHADLLLPGGNTGDAAGDQYVSIENLSGSSFNDVLLGNNAANVLSGYLVPNLPSGRDQLFGRGGNDTLRGNDNNDTLNGGSGRDTLTGGANNDIFIFNTAPNVSTNLDTITDFNHANDTIQLENAVFKALGAAGTLKSAFFFLGTQAHDANDHIIYNKANGALFYDEDGTGGHAQVEFAVLLTKPSNVAVGDFVVI
jgi:serralysin